MWGRHESPCGEISSLASLCNMSRIIPSLWGNVVLCRTSKLEVGRDILRELPPHHCPYSRYDQIRPALTTVIPANMAIEQKTSVTHDEASDDSKLGHDLTVLDTSEVDNYRGLTLKTVLVYIVRQHPDHCAHESILTGRSRSILLHSLRS
jgi:hypothetical protein